MKENNIVTYFRLENVILPVPAIYFASEYILLSVFESQSDRMGIADQSSEEQSHGKHQKARVPGAHWTMIRCKRF